MAGMTLREYNNLVDESLVLFGGGSPCCSIDSRLWDDFKETYKDFYGRYPKSDKWSFDAVNEWLTEYKKANIHK